MNLLANENYGAAGQPGKPLADLRNPYVVMRSHCNHVQGLPPSHTILTVPSNDLAGGDNKAQIAHMPASHNNQGLYPLKNESINLGNGMF